MLVFAFFPLQFLRSRYEIDYNLLHFQKNIKGTLKIHALPNFRSGDNRWTNFAPVNNAEYEVVVQRWKVTPKVSPPNLILLIFGISSLTKYHLYLVLVLKNLTFLNILKRKWD